MRIDVFSIFPGYFDALDLSLAGRARDSGLLELAVHDLRAWTHDRHRTVDDTPYGGGAGMVMKPEPWGEALDSLDLGPGGAAARRPDAGGGAVHPGASPATWPRASTWSSPAGGTRGSTSGWSTTRPSGSRCASCRWATTCSTAARWPRWPSARPSSGCCPGSWATPSRSSRSRTRAACSRHPSTPSPPPGAASTCPPVLLSGDHGAIARWRHEQSVRRTADRRPDLLSPSVLRDDVVRAPRRAGATPASCSRCSAPAGSRSSRPTPASRSLRSHESLDDVRAWLAASAGARGPLARAAGRRGARGCCAAVSWHVGRLMVAPDLQGGGLGRRLLAAIEAAGAAPRRRRTRSSPGRAAPRNQRMYKKAGYRLAGGPRPGRGADDQAGATDFATAA